MAWSSSTWAKGVWLINICEQLPIWSTWVSILVVVASHLNSATIPALPCLIWGLLSSPCTCRICNLSQYTENCRLHCNQSSEWKDSFQPQASTLKCELLHWGWALHIWNMELHSENIGYNVTNVFYSHVLFITIMKPIHYGITLFINCSGTSW